MYPNAPNQAQSAPEAGPTDHRSRLRSALISEFERALVAAPAITAEQRKALSGLLEQEAITVQAILAALTP